MNYTYILHCADGTLYCGWTNDLKKRLHAHNSGTGANEAGIRNQTAPPEKEGGADQSWLQYGSVHGCRGPGLCHKLIHHHIVTQTAAHDKQVKDLMGTEIAVSGIKDRQFQGVDDASNCVNDTACK